MGIVVDTASADSKSSLTASRVNWWRGLDSNQRTLARADLQSATKSQNSAIFDGACIAYVSWKLAEECFLRASGERGILLSVGN